jgi:uncharacterized protein with PIN domain
MSHGRLYADENFPLPVVEALRQLGYDVLTLAEDGKAEQKVSDEAVLAAATTQERILLTLNRKHFIRLHNDNANHQGIIVCTFDPNFEDQAKRIHKALEAQENVLGTLLRVNRPPE